MLAWAARGGKHGKDLLSIFQDVFFTMQWTAKAGKWSANKVKTVPDASDSSRIHKIQDSNDLPF